MFARLNVLFTFLVVAGVIPLASSQPLSSGQWSKFSVGGDGIYKIDYSLLKKSGFNPDQINPANIRLFSNGTGMLPQPNATPRQNQLTELSIFVQGQSDGKFDTQDYILFFGQGPDEYHFDISSNSFAYTNNIYSDKNFYFLTIGTVAGKRVEDMESMTGSFPLINTYNDFGYYEAEKNNILSSGREWFGDQQSSSAPTITLQFQLPGVVDNTPIVFASHVMATAFDSQSSFRVTFNGTQVLQQDIAPVVNTQYGIKGLEQIDTVTTNSTQFGAASKILQTVSYQYLPAASGYSVGYLNFFIFSLQRQLVFNNTVTAFTSAQSLSNPASTFSLSSFPNGGMIWDVTNPLTTKNQKYNFATGQTAFSVRTDTLKKFIAFTPDMAAVPLFESSVPNQNLSQLAAPDLLIITHTDFQTEASRLASFRQNQNGLTTQVVNVQQIFNEYSGGKQDVTALRDFIKDIYLRGGNGLENVLLFGRCSYDYKNLNPVLVNTNYVPTYESRNSLNPLNTYSSDDYFAFLESAEGDWPEDPAQDYNMDIGVGRISVVTALQAKAVVDKLIDYETNPARFGAWRKNMVFVADDGDYNIHQSQSDALATNIDTAHAEFTTRKIYLDQYKQITNSSGQLSPAATAALALALDDGSMLVNYTGHGSESVWAQEQILDRNLVLSLSNAPRYPLFVTATCEFGRHDDPFQISSGELLLMQPGGGAIGLVTTARPVNSSTNFQLNQSFYQALFTKSNGGYRDIGTIFRDTKNNSQSGVANRNFSLLGDPSLHLAFANDEIVLTSVKTTSGSDTIKALSTVVVQGEVQQDGSKVTAFNGTALVTLLDRPVSFLTKGDENPPFSYTQFSNALFRGNVEVQSGGFKARFTIPENLESDVAFGKITTYAFSPSQDASGSFKASIGGVENPIPLPNEGPSMKLYIGDTTFINGGIASPNTKLVIKLAAKNGIGLSDIGGKNFQVTLDDSLSFDVNPYYVATSGDTLGEVNYPLLNLARGKHNISVKAYDTFARETEGIIAFVVTDENLEISTFYNYPNPFSSSGITTFVFAHNRPGEDLDVVLTVTDFAGREVVSEQYSVPQSLTEVTLTGWNGSSFAGNKISPGVYIAKVSVRSLFDGSKNQQFTKLIIVN